MGVKTLHSHRALTRALQMGLHVDFIVISGDALIIQTTLRLHFSFLERNITYLAFIRNSSKPAAVERSFYIADLLPESATRGMRSWHYEGRPYD